MATKKKDKVVEEEIKEEQPIENTVEETTEDTTDVMNQEGIAHPLYVPDGPAQMIEENVSATTKAEISVEISEKPDTDEVLFLRKILQIQEEGCFGRHLNQLIYDKIKQLKG